MNHDYKHEQMYQEGHMSEEDRNGLIPAIRRVPAHEVRDSVPSDKKTEQASETRTAQHCPNCDGINDYTAGSCWHCGKEFDEPTTNVNHCQCRSGSPDTCPICTDMETGEKYNDNI